MKDYTLTVGLEVHAELRTKTKMFCNSKNDPEEKRPNVNICPVCMGYPGTLPVVNFEAVKQVLRFGKAVNGKLADFTEFDRKNYFYPDIPKGYQISQYKFPLVTGGELAGVALTRVHLEEDTARSSHEGKVDSLVDFNRAGVPLMELVTKPVIHSAADAVRFAKELQLVLRYLGASDANMEKGEMRVEANISVSKTDKLGTKVEVKNINSFKAVEKAIQFEIDRHITLLENGEEVVQETRGWDENKEVTFSQRAKENSHDYRYFPDPDLPKLYISEIEEFSGTNLRASLPILPEAKRVWYKNQFDLKDEDIEMYVRDQEWGSYFEEVAQDTNSDFAQLASNYISTDYQKICSDLKCRPDDTKLDPKAFRDLMEMVQSGELSSRGAKDILRELSENGGDPRIVATEKNLFQKSDKGELEKICKEIIEKETKAVAEYKNGNTSTLQYLVGQGMKVTKGSGNPQVLKEIFESLLK